MIANKISSVFNGFSRFSKIQDTGNPIEFRGLSKDFYNKYQAGIFNITCNISDASLRRT